MSAKSGLHRQTIAIFLFLMVANMPMHVAGAATSIQGSISLLTTHKKKTPATSGAQQTNYNKVEPPKQVVTIQTNADTVWFELTYDMPQWRISMLYNDGSVSAGGYDGTQMVHLMLTANDKVDWQNATNAVAQISAGKHPLDFGWPVTLAWFAWASEDFLSTSPFADMPIPWMEPTSDILAVIATNYMEIHPDSHTPSFARFAVSSDLKAKAKKNPITELLKGDSKSRTTKMSMLTVAQPGQLVGTYSVLARTNLLGRNLPVSFQVVGQSIREQKPSFQIIGACTNITEVASLPPMPQTPKSVSITDFRIRTNYPGLYFANYKASGEVWPALDSPVVQAALAQRLNARPMPRWVESQRQMIFMLGAMLILVAWPLCIWWLKNRRQNQNQKEAQ